MEENKVNTYEISFLVSTAEDAEAVKKHLADVKAEIVTEGPVNQIKLSYPIKKQESAYFGYIHFKLSTKDVEALSYASRLDSKILRFMIITPPAEKPKPRTEMTRLSKKAAAPTDSSNQALEEKLAALQQNV